MYNLPYFKENDETVVLDFVHKHPFALIAGCSENNRPVATQIPVFIEKVGNKLFLTGHMMKNTDHHKAFEKNPAVLCVFTGPHTYVSATWYSNPHQASTWNYMSVHAKGVLRFWMTKRWQKYCEKQACILKTETRLLLLLLTIFQRNTHRG